MKNIIGFAVLGIALTACGVNGTTDDYSDYSPVAEEYTENCVNTATGEVIDPGYCYDHAPDTDYYYYNDALPYGQFIVIDNSYRTKPKTGIIKTYQPKSTPLPKYVPAPKPATPVKLPAYTPAKPPVNMPPVQQNKPAVPMPQVAKPPAPPAPMPKPAAPAPAPRKIRK